MLKFVIMKNSGLVLEEEFLVKPTFTKMYFSLFEMLYFLFEKTYHMFKLSVLKLCTWTIPLPLSSARVRQGSHAPLSTHGYHRQKLHPLCCWYVAAISVVGKLSNFFEMTYEIFTIFLTFFSKLF